MGPGVTGGSILSVTAVSNDFGIFIGGLRLGVVPILSWGLFRSKQTSDYGNSLRQTPDYGTKQSTAHIRPVFFYDIGYARSDIEELRFRFPYRGVRFKELGPL